MNLSQLQIFRAVVQEGGVTRAAEKLNRVQSNVTTRVRQLEDELGVQLFLRERKKLILTPSGQTLLEYADRLLSLADEAKRAVRSDTITGIVKLGSMESTASVRLPGPLASFSQKYPDANLELRTGNPIVLSEAVLNGELDAAFVAEPLVSDHLESHVAFSEEVVIVTARTHNPITAQTPETVIVLENGCPHRRRFDEWFAAEEAAPLRVVEIGSYHAMLGCVLAGMGAALVPKSVISTFPEKQRLRINPLGPKFGRIRTLLIWRKGMFSAKVQALIDILEG